MVRVGNGGGSAAGTTPSPAVQAFSAGLRPFRCFDPANADDIHYTQCRYDGDATALPGEPDCGAPACDPSGDTAPNITEVVVTRKAGELAPEWKQRLFATVAQEFNRELNRFRLTK